ncbi:FAD-dependent oxidoreductase [Klebsiella pneumoniae subsp. ozaenae]|uniref:FAD-dependent oxidoreductase n=1 Tax=Klebsiella pneumoniae subsp. ozaenae TaxID=574 RepID=A0A377Z8M5_KLEPO|nr:FAD-dependent oxidoreductase [Klebsiella pneumoniae subsp. ozaenae]
MACCRAATLAAQGQPGLATISRGSLRQRLRQIRLDVAYAAQQGLSWQVVLDAVRQQGQRIWQALSVAIASVFLRHLRHYWDVHRYRVAPQVAEVLGGAPAHGQSAGAGGQATVDKR